MRGKSRAGEWVLGGLGIAAMVIFKIDVGGWPCVQRISAFSSIVHSFALCKLSFPRPAWSLRPLRENRRGFTQSAQRKINAKDAE